MAISTLTKISVPLANDNSANSQGLLMPKLSYRFRITLENFGVSAETQELTKQVVEATRPTLSFDPMVLDVYNSKVYLAGKHTWDTVNVTLRDDVNGNVQKLVGEQLQKQFDFFEQSSAASGTDYKFVTRIEVTDGGNGANAVTVLETFELYGCFIESANYNTLAYSSSEPVTVQLSIRYDNAIQSPQGSGIGTAIGRTVNTLATGAGGL